MNLYFRKAGIAVSVLLLAANLSATAQAADTEAVSIAQMAGTWRLAVSGFTGCGSSSMLFDVTLNSSGVGTNGVLTQHGSCGDSVITGQSFHITSLASNGSGTANFSCGTGCGWNLTIQVSRNRQVFNLVDVDPVNPGNYIAGTGVRQ